MPTPAPDAVGPLVELRVDARRVQAQRSDQPADPAPTIATTTSVLPASGSETAETGQHALHEVDAGTPGGTAVGADGGLVHRRPGPCRPCPAHQHPGHPEWEQEGRHLRGTERDARPARRSAGGRRPCGPRGRDRSRSWRSGPRWPPRWWRWSGPPVRLYRCTRGTASASSSKPPATTSSPPVSSVHHGLTIRHGGTVCGRGEPQFAALTPPLRSASTRALLGHVLLLAAAWA